MRRDDRGFTLVELIVSIMISGIVLPVLFGAVFFGLRTLDDTNEKIAGSNDTLLVASYFTSDVEGASNIATGGSRAHVTPTITLPSGVTSTALVMMYGVKGVDAVVPPATAGRVWSDAAGALTSSTADEILPIIEPGSTFGRWATTTNATSSVAQTIALRPTGIVGRRPETTNAHRAVANGSSLVLQPPTAVAANDVLVAQVTATTTAAKIKPPTAADPSLAWKEVDRVDLGTGLTSIAYVRKATALDPSSWTWGFNDGLTHDIAGGIVAYTGISGTNPVAASAHTTNPCAGEAPVASITTADRVAVSSTSYFLATSGTENQLVRQSCTDAGVVTKQILARQLQTTGGASVSCAPSACDPLPATAKLTLLERPLPHETQGRSYVLSARTRTG